MLSDKWEYSIRGSSTLSKRMSWTIMIDLVNFRLRAATICGHSNTCGASCIAILVNSASRHKPSHSLDNTEKHTMNGINDIHRDIFPQATFSLPVAINLSCYHGVLWKTLESLPMMQGAEIKGKSARFAGRLRRLATAICSAIYVVVLVANAIETKQPAQDTGIQINFASGMKARPCKGKQPQEMHPLFLWNHVLLPRRSIGKREAHSSRAMSPAFQGPGFF